MVQVKFMPHPDYCPDGAIIEAKSGDNLVELALENDIEIPHECECSCACTTCHVVVRTGFKELKAADELEEDMLGRAWGLEEQSRLGCQVIIADADLVVELPKYTANKA
jgi:ferredoxin, 2Fe-2S